MSNIGRDCVGHAIDLIILLAAQQCAADKCVAQIVNTRLRMAAAGHPTQTAAETVERVIDRSLRNRAAFGGDEDRFNAELTLRSESRVLVVPQGLRRAEVNRH